jgi:hypothetical protein
MFILADILTDNTPVSLGLIVGAMTLLGSAVWWASSINTRLDSLINILTSIYKDTEHLKNRIDAIEKRVAKTEFFIEEKEKK